MNIKKKLKRKKYLIFKINVNNKQVKTLLNNESEADLIDNTLACKSEVITFKFEQFISLHFRDRRKYQTLTKTVLMNLQIKNYHEQAFLYLTDLAEYKLILRDN